MTQNAVHSAAPHFSDFNLDARILRAIEESGYTTPTPIQSQAIPVVLSGQDVMGSAQTGTGKTASFVLPILQNILPLASTSTSPARHPVRALVLCPTRELAVQVADNAQKYAKHTPIRSAVVFGGMDIKSQTPALRAGVELLIATPGRLLDHLESGNVSLGQVNYLVLDEADRMLDMGFLPDLQRILNVLPKQRQTLLFSATFSPEIRKLAESYQKNPITIETAQRNATSQNITQTVYSVSDKMQKRSALVQLIREQHVEQAMIFVNTKIEARELTRFLQRAKINAQSIHGDQSQTERLATLEGFKKNEVLILVATDVAARGLDISLMPCVINFDLPYNAEDYVHRIGRTGRAGSQGRALSIATPHDDRLLAAICKLTKQAFTAIPLEPTPSREERPRSAERTARPPRAEGEAPRVRNNERSAPHRRSAVEEQELSHLRRKVNLSSDPFFTQPYQPSPSTMSDAEKSKHSTWARPNKQGQNAPVAALFKLGKPSKR
ncbi:ATP-dependent RNA helicase RhlE [Ephemeroptericola cinctiostellae]|uniref:DEAD-box ATP-dependent RNA helicase RhpA n=1 Tax=Ephemeroptericola cinctiostellae TaxID=2268024 RepID=A0A345D7H9_9BURK|nr:DEAD/DEAH box helicase [Ephemeroptericola cinctiostellae]AXF84317.1 ATP-dependent RNA helicase RhlE [Ephemeroptericola cinctiostellae]